VKDFVALFAALDATTRTNAKVQALVHYFENAPPADAAWALALLAGRRPPRPVTTTRMRAWAAQAAGIPDWLFAESYSAVGDLGETIALLAANPGAQPGNKPLATWMEEIRALKAKPEDAQQAYVLQAWQHMDVPTAFVFNKLIGGSFRVGVSKQLVIKALAQVLGQPEATLAHKLMGNWQPAADFFTALKSETLADDYLKPYPFYLAYALDDVPETLGNATQWLAEWKWDGIRAQVVARSGQVFIWSRGEELVTDRFPELAQAAKLLPPGTVVDGEVLPYGYQQGILPFAQLQKRITRKNVSAKLLREVPVQLFAYDLLEHNGADLRAAPLHRRRALLAGIIQTLPTEAAIRLSPSVAFADWPALHMLHGQAATHRAEGLMLKQVDSAYGTGRRRGNWWKWKVAPLAIDAVLVYAQRGTGRRANLYTDYTFALWHNGKLVTFAKAYSGLTDEEIAEVDRFVKANTLEKFGPVRTVKPALVFELAFEGVQASPRHKSGVAVRFPRIARWRTDKKMEDADTLDTLLALIPK
jgi:DNA ligase-1